VPRKSDHPTAYYLSGRAKGLPKVPRRPEPSLLDHRHGSGHPWPLSRAVGCWVTAVAPTVKTIPPKPCPGISEIGVFRNCPDPEMLVSPEPSSKSQVSRVKHSPWDVGGTPFLLLFPRWDQISHAPTTIAETTNPAKAKPIVQTYLFCPLAKAPSVTPSANLVVQSKLLQKYK
jgi:hypothetical protein